MKEVWKPVKGYEGIYEVSNTGKFKTLARMVYGDTRIYPLKEKILVGTLNHSGYTMVFFGGKQRRLHRIVAEAFIPKVKGKNCINHKNGIKTDNRIENIEWCTRSENNKHAHAMGLINNAGANNGHTHLTDTCVQNIKNIVKLGIAYQKDIANHYNISPSTLTDIIKGRTWRHVK